MIIRCSFLYTWMKRLIRKLSVEVEDMQPLLALNQEELDEYNTTLNLKDIQMCQNMF